MSAVLPSRLGAATRGTGDGVWRAAWRRLRGDRVGVVSLAVGAAFLLLILASSLGVVAADWQREIAVPNAPPAFMGPKAKSAQSDIAQPSGPDCWRHSTDAAFRPVPPAPPFAGAAMCCQPGETFMR